MQKFVEWKSSVSGNQANLNKKNSTYWRVVLHSQLVRPLNESQTWRNSRIRDGNGAV